ncbi:nuclear transport factor 2 family protein [Bradyrhizobium pachyrhizi]|uniref:nuclear transport factor 2 family protein n=1 Tax=Bradyrhizobium pachyrhizi TaxID=280333 RepID=UPI003D368A78
MLSSLACEWGVGRTRSVMSNTSEAFDAGSDRSRLAGRCRQGRLPDLLELYDDDATVDCSEGGRFEGRCALRAYLTLKLLDQDPGAFEIKAVVPETSGVCIEYHACGGQTVRTHFRFSSAGKIAHTTCGPLVGKGDGLAA